MVELYIHIGIAVWWSFAVVIFVVTTATSDSLNYEVLGIAVLWPIAAIFGFLVVLWRIPFKTVRTMKQDIRNKGQWRDFQHWLDEKDKTDE